MIKLKKINKRGEVMGLSFSMIFSIILIVFFIAAAFVGIKFFLNYQKNMQINLFVKDLQNKVDEAWNCDTRCSFIFNSTLPSTANYVCAIDFSKNPKNANNIEMNIYDNIKKESYSTDKNLYFYYPKKPYILNSMKIKNIDLNIKNPVCFKIINNKVSIKIEKKADNPLVILS